MSTATLQPKKEAQEKPKTVFEALERYGHDEDFEPLVTPASREDYRPTGAAPGSEEKIRLLTERLEKGLPLWHDDDRNDFKGFKATLAPRPDDQPETQLSEVPTLIESLSAVSADSAPAKRGYVPKLISGQGSHKPSSPTELRAVERDARLALSSKLAKKRAALKEQAARSDASHNGTIDQWRHPALLSQVSTLQMPAPVQPEAGNVLHAAVGRQSPLPRVSQPAQARRGLQNEKPAASQTDAKAAELSEPRDRPQHKDWALNDQGVGSRDRQSGAREVFAKDQSLTSVSDGKPQVKRQELQKARSPGSVVNAGATENARVLSVGHPDVIKIPQGVSGRTIRPRPESPSRDIISIRVAGRTQAEQGPASEQPTVSKSATSVPNVTEVDQHASLEQERLQAPGTGESLEECLRNNSITNSAVAEFRRQNAGRVPEQDASGLTPRQRDVLRMLQNLQEAVEKKGITESALTQFKNEHKKILSELAPKEVCA